MFPAGAPGIAVKYLTLGNGVRIRIAESGSAEAPAAILLHGWGACMYSYDEMMPALAAAGLHPIAMDLPGHGLSDKPRATQHYSTAALADAVVEVAQQLHLERYSLVGHSMGAMIALDIVLRPVHSVDRLVLIGGVGLGRAPGLSIVKFFSPSFVDRFTPRMVTRGLVAAILRVAYASSGRPNDRDIDQYWAPSQFPEYAYACRACLHEGRWRHLDELDLRAMRVPVLAISGDRDRFVRGALRRARLIPGARVLRIAKAGHVVLQERPRQVNADVVNFLEARLERR